MERGTILKDYKVVFVGDNPVVYQDKYLWEVRLNNGKPQDYHAMEVTQGPESQLRKYIFDRECPAIVVISKGSSTKPDWVKIDEPMPVKSGMEERDKMFLSRDAFKLAGELYAKYLEIRGPAQPLENAVQIISGVAAEIAKETIKLANSL